MRDLLYRSRKTSTFLLPLFLLSLSFFGASLPHFGGDMAAAEADRVPRLTVKDWYFELDGQPIYLAGHSPNKPNDIQQYGQPVVGRFAELPDGVNFMRTWLEWFKGPEFQSPFMIVDGKADLSVIDPAWLETLREFLDASVHAGVVPEITLFNPWGARNNWEGHWWNPANNVQGYEVDEHSLYSLDNPYQSYQERFTEQVLEIVDQSLARHFTIIEIDNELETGGGSWREHFVGFVKARGDYIVSTIASYCGDYDTIGGDNDIISLHGGFSGSPNQYYDRTMELQYVKPVIFNELYVWDRHSREAQRAVLWNIFLSGGMFNVHHWGGGDPDESTTAAEVAAVGRFANSISFPDFRPDDSWVVGGPGEVRAVSHTDNTAFIAYLWDGGEGVLEISLPEASYELTWLNPISGEPYETTEHFDAAGVTVLTPPTYDFDIVCHIVAVN